MSSIQSLRSGHTARHTAPQARRGLANWSARGVFSAAVGMSLVGGVAYAATNWIVGLSAGSNGQAQSATVSNLTITAMSSPAPSNLLFPGGTGDVVAKITNPNGFPVTVTSVNLPTNATYAGGYSDAALTSSQTGCTAVSPSGVTWSFATGSSGTSHTLTTPVTVAANGNITLTFTNAASMALTAPSACQNTFFSMPSLTGVGATGGAATTTVATTDSWTS